MAEERTVSPDTIAEDAAAPASVDIDGAKFSQHPLPDQIAADRYTRSANSMKPAFNPAAAIRTVRKISPGMD